MRQIFGTGAGCIVIVITSCISIVVGLVGLFSFMVGQTIVGIIEMLLAVFIFGAGIGATNLLFSGRPKPRRRRHRRR